MSDMQEFYDQSLKRQACSYEEAHARSSLGLMSTRRYLNVFVSYAAADEKYRRQLDKHLVLLVREKLLRVSGQHCIQPGAVRNDEARRQLFEADIVLLLCSADYFTSEDCYVVELAQTLKRHEKKEVLLIPMLVRECGLPAALTTIQSLPRDGKHIAARRDRDRAFAEVAQVLRDAAENRAGTLVADQDRKELLRAQAFGFHVDEPHDLQCDRSEQWSQMDALAQASGHTLILVPGAAGQGHIYFHLRIYMGLRRDPPREIVWLLPHGQIPRYREDYYAALAQALDCSEGELLEALGRRLAVANLILLHPVIDSDYEDPKILDCLTQWLPDLLDRAQGKMCLKCIQPISWKARKTSLFERASTKALVTVLGRGSVSALTSLLRGRDGKRDSDRIPCLDLAYDMIEVVSQRVRPGLPIRRLPDLTQIERVHVEALCDILDMPAGKRGEFIDRVLYDSSCSEEILRAILRYVRDYRRPRGSS